MTDAKALPDFNKASPPPPGTLTKEGIYIGRLAGFRVSERDYFAAPADAQDSNGKRLSLQFNQAAEYAKKATDLGHNDWALPTSCNDSAPDVLEAMFNNKGKGAFNGTFEETDPYPATGYSNAYWSSSRAYIPGGSRGNAAYIMRFSDGQQLRATKEWWGQYFVRPVRSLAV